MQNSCHFGEYEGAGTVICKYRYILGNYNQKVNSKGNGNDKKRCTGPLRRWPELRGEEFSCDQGDVLVCRFQRKRLRQGQPFWLHVPYIIFISLHWLLATQFFDLHIIQLRGSSKEDKPPVYLSWNCSRTTQDWRGFPRWLGNLIWGSLQFPETYVPPKNPD